MGAAAKKKTTPSAAELADRFIAALEARATPAQRMEINAAKVVLRTQIEAVLTNPEPDQLAAAAVAWAPHSQRLLQIAEGRGVDVTPLGAAMDERLEHLRDLLKSPLANIYLVSLERIRLASLAPGVPTVPPKFRDALAGALFGRELAVLLGVAQAKEAAFQVLDAAARCASRYVIYMEGTLGLSPFYQRAARSIEETVAALGEIGQRKPEMVTRLEGVMRERRRSRQPMRRRGR